MGQLSVTDERASLSNTEMAVTLEEADYPLKWLENVESDEGA